MTGYSGLVGIESQPGVTQGRLPRMLLYNNPIPYWFFGNGRRFVVVAKVGSVYETCYMGFILPFGLPTQFPYPMVIGGSACPTATVADHRYSSTAWDHKAWPNGYGDSTDYGTIAQGTFDVVDYRFVLKAIFSGSWVGVLCLGTNTSDPYTINNIWPYGCSLFAQQSNPDALPNNIFSVALRENLDGSYPIFPLVMMFSNPFSHIHGVLQGAFAVPGFGGISAEDTFIVNGDTYITFPTLYNPARNHWFAMKKE